MKIAVLGGGISGLSATLLLQTRGFDVFLYEKEPECGGLCRTKLIEDYVFDLHGGHIFNSKYPEVKEFVFSILPQEYWQWSERNAFIDYASRKIPYPFELSLTELPIDDAIESISDFLSCSRTESTKPDNFREWIYWMFGKGIADRYMIPYNEKIWARDLSTMGISWVDGKMPLPSNNDLIRSLLCKDCKEILMPHSSYFYPRHGGIQSLINVMSSQITNIYTNYTITKVEHSPHITINGERFEHCISAIPLPELATIVNNIDPHIKDIILSLPYNSLTTALYKYDKSDISWVYHPDKNKNAHRTVYQGNFSDNIPGSITFEKTGECNHNDIINGLDVTSQDYISHSFTKYAYPVFNRKYDADIVKIRSYFNSIGIGLIGRFAEWKYYNMDTCIKRAHDYVEMLLSPASPASSDI